METLGVGKFVVDNTDPNWNYPHFHVLVFREENEDEFCAFCMELGIVAYSNESEQDVFSKVIDNSLDMISWFGNDIEKLFCHLHSAAQSNANDGFWKEYRIAETLLAKTANDLGNSFISELTRACPKLVDLVRRQGGSMFLKRSVLLCT